MRNGKNQLRRRPPISEAGVGEEEESSSSRAIAMRSCDVKVLLSKEVVGKL